MTSKDNVFVAYGMGKRVAVTVAVVCVLTMMLTGCKLRSSGGVDYVRASIGAASETAGGAERMSTDAVDDEMPSAVEADRAQTEAYGDLRETRVQRKSSSDEGETGYVSLFRTGYILQYDPLKRIPVWVAWRLTADHTDGNHKREGIKFTEDEDVEDPRATDADYRGSGYDRGHMCPSGDNKWSRKAQEESFLFTNICPQLHNLNAGDWNELEKRCRHWAKAYGEVYIVCGPVLLNKKHKTIGRNKVVVPEAFFKVVLRLGDDPQAIGFIYRNEERNSAMSSYVNTVDDVERITGLDFFASLPTEMEKQLESKASLDDWE